MYDPVDARFRSLRQASDGLMGGEDPDSPDPPRGSATGRRLQLSKESHSKKEQ